MPTPTIIGEEKKKEGILKFGATDPITGRRFEEFTPNITSEMLIPAPSVPFVTPQDVPVFSSVAGLDSTTPPLQLTEPEKQAQDITKQLQELNQQLLGQSTLQAEQEKVQGIPELQKTQTDLTAQLKAIQNEALAIPLQLQKEATGRGITVGGLQPLQTARLSTNAIQALGVSSLLEASRGNLATAQTLADRAVAQKFDPIKEQIAVKTANLELIIKSPAYTLADKNRAQAQLDIQNKQKKAVEKQEADFAAILATANEASKNGADALTLDRISKAKTPIEALQAAQGFMDAEKITTSIQEIGGRKLLINSQTGQTIKDLGTSDNVVGSLIIKYPDAGIFPTDTLEQAQAKLPSSKIYQQATRLAGRGGGTTPRTTPEPTDIIPKFTPKEIKRVQALGISGWGRKIQNVVLNKLTPAEQRKFIDDFNTEQQKRKQSLDPEAYILEWAAKQNEEQSSKIINPLR